jgi:hypothetical protein
MLREKKRFLIENTCAGLKVKRRAMTQLDL